MFLAINPGRVSGTCPAPTTKDPAFGLPAVWIERRAARAGAGHGLHRRRRRHGRRHASVDGGARPGERAARPAGSAKPARADGQDLAQAGRGPGAEAAAARGGAARAAEPARRGRAHPRHAHHPRDACRSRRAHAGPERADRRRARRARTRHRAATLRHHARAVGDRPRSRLVPDRLRSPLARLLRRSVAALRVLAHSEVPDARTIRVSAMVGGKR